MSTIENAVVTHPHKDLVIHMAESVMAAPFVDSMDFATEYRSLAESYAELYHKQCKTLATNEMLEQLINDLTSNLEKSRDDVQLLRDLGLPLCLVCHKVNITNDYWMRLEEFFSKHADIAFSQGICPDCIKQTYGKLGEQMLVRKKNAGNQHVLQKPKESKGDDSLVDLRMLVERAVSGGNPLAAEIEKLVSRYAKLHRRFNKIVSLSDSYQSQLREFNLRLELMAHTDPLTGISNRGYFMELLNLELTRANRHERIFSVMMLDLDHFKSINDTYGHAAGDEALRSVPRVVQGADLRKTDFFGRVGGEEFAICLPETNLQGAAKVAEKIRANLEKNVVSFKGNELHLTVSIGVSEYMENDTEESLLQRADMAMYQAKKGGRNRVCLSY